MVTRCAVERLVRTEGLAGTVRKRRVYTIVLDETAARPANLAQEHFAATGPNARVVADCTYVATWGGTVYVEFVINVSARRILGWRARTTMQTELVQKALEQALHDGVPDDTAGAFMVHADLGSTYVSVRFTERLAAVDAGPSVVSVGDAYADALANR